jgi:hypothetical protein
VPVCGASFWGGAEFGDQVDEAVAGAGRGVAGVAARADPFAAYAHRLWLLDQVASEPGLTLAEVRERLAAEHGLSAGIAAIWSFYRREGISFKKNAAAVRAGQARRREAAGELAALPGRGRG